jgi:hypothetical protein
MNQLNGRWTNFQIEAEYDSFGVLRIVNAHNELIEKSQVLEARITKLEQFLVGLSANYDCDQDAHKYGTPCRSCSAEDLMRYEARKQ